MSDENIRNEDRQKAPDDEGAAVRVLTLRLRQGLTDPVRLRAAALAGDAAARVVANVGPVQLERDDLFGWVHALAAAGTPPEALRLVASFAATETLAAFPSLQVLPFVKELVSGLADPASLAHVREIFIRNIRESAGLTREERAALSALALASEAHDLSEGIVDDCAMAVHDAGRALVLAARERWERAHSSNEDWSSAPPSGRTSEFTEGNTIREEFARKIRSRIIEWALGSAPVG
jgi:hypothetical protein